MAHQERTGKLLVTQALSDNHTVTAFVRNPSNFNISDPNLLIVQGDVTDASAVKKAILGHDAVISTLGTNTGLRKTIILHEMTQNIVQVMRDSGYRELLTWLQRELTKKSRCFWETYNEIAWKCPRRSSQCSGCDKG